MIPPLNVIVDVGATITSGAYTVGALLGEGIATAIGDEEALVIGRMDDMRPRKLGPGEYTLPQKGMFDQGSPKATWKQNDGMLREEMRRGSRFETHLLSGRTGQAKLHGHGNGTEPTEGQGWDTRGRHLGTPEMRSGVGMVGRFVPSPERARFRFSEIVLDAFGYLVSDFGYAVSRTDVTLVSWFGSGGEVRLYHGRGSYEVGFEMVFPGSDEVYSLYDLLVGVGECSRAGEISNAGSTPERMQETVGQIAEIARDTLHAVFRGDREALGRIRSTTQKRERAARSQIQIEQVRAKSDRAWKTQGYDEYVRLLDDLKKLAELTAVEKKRLQIAARKQ